MVSLCVLCIPKATYSGGNPPFLRLGHTLPKRCHLENTIESTGYEYGCRVAATAFAFRDHTNPLMPNKINELENFFFCKGERHLLTTEHHNPPPAPLVAPS